MDPEELELVKTEYEDLRIRYHKQTRRLKVSLRVVFTSILRPSASTSLQETRGRYISNSIRGDRPFLSGISTENMALSRTFHTTPFETPSPII